MKKFCVIGACVGSAIRTWAESQEEAVAHATALVQKQFTENGKPVSLLVVEIKQVIEIGIPPVVVREPVELDTESFDGDETEGRTVKKDRFGKYNRNN